MAKAGRSGGALGGCGVGGVYGGDGGVTTGGSPFATLWICNAAVSINAWLWSTVFHARDTTATRTMDYASVRFCPGDDCGRVHPINGSHRLAA
jgi:hypothetical protein